MLIQLFPFDKTALFWYSSIMKKKNLTQTNPYLKNPAERKAAIIMNVATSSAIEGVPLSAFSDLLQTKKETREKSAAR